VPLGKRGGMGRQNPHFPQYTPATAPDMPAVTGARPLRDSQVTLPRAGGFAPTAHASTVGSIKCLSTPPNCSRHRDTHGTDHSHCYPR
jgi:hypothetical protein